MWELTPTVPGPPKLRPAMIMTVLVESLWLVSDGLLIPACVRGRQFLTRRERSFVHTFSFCQWQYACLPRAPTHPCRLTTAAHSLLSAALLCLWPLVLVDLAFKSASLGNLGWLCPIIEMNDCCTPGLIAHIIYSFLFSWAPICTEKTPSTIKPQKKPPITKPNKTKTKPQKQNKKPKNPSKETDVV